jgi:hypothetical protein
MTEEYLVDVCFLNNLVNSRNHQYASCFTVRLLKVHKKALVHMQAMFVAFVLMVCSLHRYYLCRTKISFSVVCVVSESVVPVCVKVR